MATIKIGTQVFRANQNVDFATANINANTVLGVFEIGLNYQHYYDPALNVGNQLSGFQLNHDYWVVGKIESDCPYLGALPGGGSDAVVIGMPGSGEQIGTS